MSPGEFNRLLSGFYAGSLSPEEAEALKQVLHDPARKEELESFFGDSLAARPGIEAPATLDFIFRQVQSANNPPVVRRVHFLQTAMFRYAAAVILLLGISTYLYIINRPHVEPLTLTRNTGKKETDIPPGGNKATLTLSNGSTIVLDSAANGLLAMQGNTRVVKNANGKIVYDLSAYEVDAVVMNTMSTPRGGQYQLTLPDGTRVWLNAASSITYPVVFAGKQRNVKVTGEVYFEVAKNRVKPFIVDVNGKSSMEVLGTHFNVKSYDDENSIKMTLLEGSVKVAAPAGGQSVILTPGQQAQLALGSAAGAPLKVVSNVDMEKVMAWKNGFFDLQEASFPEVAKLLEKWYDIRVVYEGKTPQIRFRGYMDRGINLSGVLHLFSELGIKTKLEGRTLTVI